MQVRVRAMGLGEGRKRAIESGERDECGGRDDEGRATRACQGCNTVVVMINHFPSNN